MTITLNGDKLVLSPRITNDVLALAEWADAQSNFDLRTEFVFMASTLSQSLKSTSKSYKWKFWKRFKYVKYTPSFVMQKVPHSVLTDLFWKIDEIEGGVLKKKTSTIKNSSPETNQNT